MTNWQSPMSNGHLSHKTHQCYVDPEAYDSVLGVEFNLDHIPVTYLLSWHDDQAMPMSTLNMTTVEVRTVSYTNSDALQWSRARICCAGNHFPTSCRSPDV